MARRVGDESQVANGFATARPDHGRALSVAASAAALGTPLVGAVYGVVRVGYEEYYRALGLSPEAVGLGQAAIVSRVAVVVGLALLIIATYLAFGVTVYRLAAPLTARTATSRRWYEQLGWLISPVALLVALVVACALVLRWLGAGTDGTVWVIGAVSVGVVALQLSWFRGLEPDLGGGTSRVVRFIYVKGLPRVGWLIAVAVGGGYLAVSVENFWQDSWREGRKVRATGKLSVDYLNVTASPARVIPKGDDALGVCDGSRRAVLVGRNADTSFVLLLPGRDGDDVEVVPLRDEEYAVASATGEPQTCNRRVS